MVATSATMTAGGNSTVWGPVSHGRVGQTQDVMVGFRPTIHDFFGDVAPRHRDNKTWMVATSATMTGW
jgi:hypothetical protein